MLEAHDRGGFYTLWYKVTGSAQALQQAQISTFSAYTGGIALAANFIIQGELPSYPGIYSLSQQVAQSAFDLLEGKENDLMQRVLDAYFRAPPNTVLIRLGPTTDYLAPGDDELFASAQFAWASNALQAYFPGNALLTNQGEGYSIIDPGFKKHSPGTDAVFAAIFGAAPALFGKRLSDFAGLPGYASVDVVNQVTQEHSTNVADANGKTVYVGAPFSLRGTLRDIGIFSLSPLDAGYYTLSPDFIEFRRSATEGSPLSATFNQKNFNDLFDRAAHAPPYIPYFAQTNQVPTFVGTSGQATSGSDTIFGLLGPTTFDGHGASTSGIDIEQGNSGADTFIFNKGYGNLYVSESAGYGHTTNAVLLLKPGVTTADIVVSANLGGDLVLGDGVEGDQVTVAGEFASGFAETQDGVARIQFNDGSVLTRQQIVTRLTVGTGGADRLFGLFRAVTTFDGKGPPAGTSDYEQGGGSFDFNTVMVAAIRSSLTPVMVI